MKNLLRRFISFLLPAKVVEDVEPAKPTNVEKKKSKNRPVIVWTDEHYATIGATINKYMEQKPFLHKDFDLKFMEKVTGISYYHLTTYFSKHLKINFAEWKNRHRIMYSIQLMSELSKKGGYNLDNISRKCGFKSKQWFVESYEKITGYKPSEYVKIPKKRGRKPKNQTVSK